MNKSESITNIAAALVKAQKAMGNAVKDAKNPFFKSNFADLNAVREACIPAFNANGITILQPTVQVEGRPFVETVLLHESGEFISSLTEVLCAKQNDPQAHGSGVSYARRYGLQSLVNLGSVDDDGESATNIGNQFTPKKDIVKEVQAKSGTSTAEIKVADVVSPSSSKALPVTASTQKKTVGFAKPKPSTPTTSVSTQVESGDIDL